jgi:Zn-dependent M28 family amino/carboxypeptidase
MRELIEQLCSDRCAGRRPGTPGSVLARRLILDALRGAGLDPHEQRVDGCNGANILARIPGNAPGYVLLGAHFDHLGTRGRDIYRGADDNAAAVAIVVEVARSLGAERSGRGVIIAAFDGEEPPYFMSDGMGSQHFLHTTRDRIDFMVCMDLVGHRFGLAGVPDEVGESIFALGSERSTGTFELVSSLKRREPGVIIRPADAEIVPPLSDYLSYWEAGIPFLFLSAGRSRVYHTPDDTPDLLDYGKLSATARWLTHFVRATRTRDVHFTDGRFDAATLDEVGEILGALCDVTPEAELGLALVRDLRTACDRAGNLPDHRRNVLADLVLMLEARLQ